MQDTKLWPTHIACFFDQKDRDWLNGGQLSNCANVFLANFSTTNKSQLAQELQMLKINWYQNKNLVLRTFP